MPRREREINEGTSGVGRTRRGTARTASRERRVYGTSGSIYLSPRTHNCRWNGIRRRRRRRRRYPERNWTDDFRKKHLEKSMQSPPRLTAETRQTRQRTSVFAKTIPLNGSKRSQTFQTKAKRRRPFLAECFLRDKTSSSRNEAVLIYPDNIKRTKSYIASSYHVYLSPRSQRVYGSQKES